MIDEYDVTFAVKEWLISKGWRIIAFNPPGAQGTFTIPNPRKAVGYKGQTGSLSPDIIGIKNSKYLIVVESKPYYKKDDIQKLISLFEDEERVELLKMIVDNVCKANNINFNKDECVIILAKAHGGKIHPENNIETFHISIKENWNASYIKSSENPLDYIKLTYYPSSKIKESIIKN